MLMYIYKRGSAASHATHVPESHTLSLLTRQLDTQTQCWTICWLWLAWCVMHPIKTPCYEGDKFWQVGKDSRMWWGLDIPIVRPARQGFWFSKNRKLENKKQKSVPECDMVLSCVMMSKIGRARNIYVQVVHELSRFAVSETSSWEISQDDDSSPFLLIFLTRKK